MKRWPGLLLLLIGLVLLAVGLLNLGRLLASPLETQRGYLAQTVLPLVAGLWAVIGGIYTLTH
jgi:hypothetical protein